MSAMLVTDAGAITGEVSLEATVSLSCQSSTVFGGFKRFILVTKHPRLNSVRKGSKEGNMVFDRGLQLSRMAPSFGREIHPGKH